MKLISMFGVVLILTGIITYVLADGACGRYFLKGFALTKGGDTLKNSRIFVHLRSETDTIQTDSNGNYQASISWGTACPTGNYEWQIKRKNDKYNAPIVFEYNKIKITVVNYWREATNTQGDSVFVKKVDIVF